MTGGSLQHNVAVVFMQPLRASRLIYETRYACGRNIHHRSKRWQSTATKETSISSGVQTSSSRNEIPFDCFVETSDYVAPSLDKTTPKTTVDLSTTRPAKLDSPAAPEQREYADGKIPLGDRAKYLFKLGKSYLLFYKTGLKNVWQNSKQYRAIRGTFQGYSMNNIAKYGGQQVDDKVMPSISRSEYQLCVRTRHDLFKMIPFSLVFIICGEFTPLVIVALGSAVVPYTCRIPQQIRKDMDKKLRQDQNYMDDLPRLHPQLETPLEAPDWRVEHADAYRLGLTSLRLPIPVLGPIYHALLTRPKLVRHCDNLVADAILIHREGGALKLSHQDVYEFADSYGLYALRQYIRDCQKAGQDPHNEKLKTALIPKVDAEIKYMLNEIGDWSRLKPSEQWRIGLRTLGSRSPDWQARVEDMRKHWKQA